MARKRKLSQWILIGALLVAACTTPATQLPAITPGTTEPAEVYAATATATPEPTPEIDAAVQAMQAVCSNVLPGLLCLAERPALLEAQPDHFLMPFNTPGQVWDLGEIQRLKLGGAGSAPGLALLRIRSERQESAFTVVAFGDVELINEVPVDTREFNGMQSFQLTTGGNKEGEAPVSGLLVQAPDDGELSTLIVNGVILSFGSTAVLSSLGSSLVIQTLAGAVGVSSPFGLITTVVQGTAWTITPEQLAQSAVSSDTVASSQEIADRDARIIGDAFKRYTDRYGDGSTASPDEIAQRDWRMIRSLMQRYYGVLPEAPEPYMKARIQTILDWIKREQEKLRRLKNWKGGWWKVTYGPATVTGSCKLEAVGDGGSGDGEPYTQEIPICRGNNGNTLLMYDSGASYDKIGPNLFASSFMDQMGYFQGSNPITRGGLETIQVVSPTRMILNHTNSESGGCSSSSVIYLDFVRDDPNIRCGKVVYMDPFTTPEAPTPMPKPQNVDPPIEGEYTARFGLLSKACDPQAEALAPNFPTASLSLSPENALAIQSPDTRYQLDLVPLPFEFYSEQTESVEKHLGIFTLQEPLADSYTLMMTLMQIPEQQWSGNWLVTNEDATQLCSGSVDLISPKE